MTPRILTTILDLPAETWKALAAPSTFSTYEYLSVLERSGMLADNGFLPRYLTLWDQQPLVAALPAYLKQGEDDDLLPDWAARVARKHGLPYDPTLFIGTPFARVPGRKLLVAPGVPPDRAIAALITAAQELARTLPAPVIHMYFSTADEVAQLAPLGFVPRTSPRYQWSNTGYTSFDAFLAELVPRRASSIRYEQRKIARAGFATTLRRGHEIDNDTLSTFWTLYGNTVEKYERAGYTVPRTFYEGLRDSLPQQTELITWSAGTTVSAAILCIIADNTYFPLYWGQAGDNSLLPFAMIYTVIEQAISRGFRAVDLGGTVEYQLLRGFVPVGDDHSASWIGDESLAEAFEGLVGKERAWMPGDVAQKLARSPYRAHRSDNIIP